MANLEFVKDKASIVIGAVALLVIVTVVAKLRPSARPPIASESIEAFLDDSLEDHGIVYDFGRCDGSVCPGGTQAGAPTYAWRLLAWAGMYNQTGNQKYRELAKKDFGRFVENIDDAPPLVLLHQVYEAWNILQEPSFAEFFYRSARYNVTYFAKLTPQNKGGDTMTTATAIRQLYLLNRFAQDSRALSQLKELKLYGAPEAAKQIDEVESLKVAARLEQQIDINLRDPDDLKQDKCFAAWAWEAEYQSNKDPAILEKIKSVIQREYLESLTTTQMILPCIDVLARLPELKVDFDRENYFRWFFDHVWDRPQRKLCTGDNGFIATLLRNKEQCSSAYKYTADTSWAAFLLNQYPALYK